MTPLTYRSILRTYADGVEGGAYDRDITDAKERKFVALTLRTISNDGVAAVPYAETHSERGRELREGILRGVANRAWDSNVSFYVEVAGPKAREAYSRAVERAFDIARNI